MIKNIKRGFLVKQKALCFHTSIVPWDINVIMCHNGSPSSLLHTRWTPGHNHGQQKILGGDIVFLPCLVSTGYLSTAVLPLCKLHLLIFLFPTCTQD